MRFDNLRRQLAKLEAQIPKEIVIQLRDGTEFRHPGPVADFVVEGMRQGHEGDGPIWRACRNSDQVSIYPGSGDQLVTLIRIASGCGAPLDEKG